MSDPFENESAAVPGVLRPLLQEALQGNEGALHALMTLMATAHYRRIVGFLKKNAGARTQTIEVAFQDSMVRFHELVSKGDLEIHGDILSWILWFCLRTLRNERQPRLSPAHERHWSRLNQLAEEIEARGQAGPPTLAVRKEAIENLRRARAQLPPRMRQVLELQLSGATVQDISRRLGISPKTVYDLQEKARTRLLLFLAPPEEPPDRAKDRTGPRLKAAIETAMKQLPEEIRDVLEGLHRKGLSPRKAAAELGLDGLDDVLRLRDDGYRRLSRTLGLPFPESFNYLG